jgi:putative transposase
MLLFVRRLARLSLPGEILVESRGGEDAVPDRLALVESTMECSDPEGVLPEAQRRLCLLGSAATETYDYHRLKARAAQTYVPLKVLWTWWQAYQKQREEGLIPTDWTSWTALPAKTQDVITERLTLLGKVVTARAFPDECDLDAYIPELAKQNQWSLRTAERWVRRYQVGGWWGLAPEHDPAKAGREQKESVVPALGTLTDSELETTFHRRSLLGDLANKTRVSRAEVEAQARAVGIGRSTLWLYLKHYRAAGISGLAPKERSDKHGHHRLAPHMKEIIRGVRFSQVDKPVRSVYKAVCQKAEALGEPAPSEWQVRKICAEMLHAEVLLADRRDDEFRNRYEVTRRMEQLRQQDFRIIYMIDHTPVDVLVKDLRGPKYRTQSGEVRPWLTTCVDSRSRLLMAAVFGYDRPDRYTVATAIRDAVLTSENKLYGGIPHEIWVDNGKELLSHHVYQLTEALHIVLHPCKPHHPQERAIGERFFGTLNTRLWADQPGYVASNTEERNPHAKAHLTLAELEERFWTFIHKEYHQEVHSQTKETPLDYWMVHCYAEPAKVRELDVLLKEPKRRVILKDGIYYRGRLYWDSRMPAHVGVHVVVRAAPIYRPPDEIEVYLEKNRQWLCAAKATDSPAGQAITQLDIANAKREQRASLRGSIEQALEAAKAVDREIAALPSKETDPDHPKSEQETAATPRTASPSDGGTALPTHPPVRPKKKEKPIPPTPPQKVYQGDFLERMAVREEERRKREEA